MNDVLKVARLDLRVVLPYSKQMLIVLAIAPVFGFVMHDPRSVIPASVVYTSMLVSYPFSIGDKHDLATLYGVLPLARSRIVLGRYAFALAAFPVVALVGLVTTVAIAPVLGATVTGTELAVLVVVSLGLFALLVSLQFPLYFWLGYTKARLVATIPFFVLFAAIVLLAPLLEGTLAPPAGAVAAGGLLGSVALLTASVLLSTRLDARRVD
jgi:hypothetical protein